MARSFNQILLLGFVVSIVCNCHAADIRRFQQMENPDQDIDPEDALGANSDSDLGLSLGDVDQGINPEENFGVDANQDVAAPGPLVEENPDNAGNPGVHIPVDGYDGANPENPGMNQEGGNGGGNPGGNMGGNAGGNMGGNAGGNMGGNAGVNSGGNPSAKQRVRPGLNRVNMGANPQANMGANPGKNMGTNPGANIGSNQGANPDAKARPGRPEAIDLKKLPIPSEMLRPDSKKRFRVQKVNLLWEKAKRKRLSGEPLMELYGDLVVQDQLEIDTKKMKTDGHDDTGDHEALVRQKFLSIVRKYELHSEDHLNTVNQMGGRENMPNAPTLDGDKKMDQRLAKIWTKARDSGFTDAEMEDLRREFLHHQQKLDEFDELKNEVDSYDGMDNNLTEMKDDYDPTEHKQKKADLKAKWREIKDGYMTMEMKTAAGGADKKLTFNDPKVANLFKLAENANFSEIELESFKEELKHFEHKLEKHDFFRRELAMQAEKVRSDPRMANNPVGTEHLTKLEEKVQDHSKRIKKIHHELKNRIKEKTEL